MNNKTKILIGISLAGIAYLIWRSKKAPTSTASINLPVEKIDEHFKKEVPKSETPSTPSTPSTPESPSTPAPSSPATPVPSEPVAPVIPPFDFEQYFKDHPIVIDPNIGSSLVNTNIPQQQKCMSVDEWLTRKQNGTLPPDNSYCIEGNGLIITDKERLQNAFKMKEVKNEFSIDPLGLNTFMQRGTNYDYLDTPEGENNNGALYNRFSCDPFGFGGMPSC
jgi:hypothetical protein